MKIIQIKQNGIGRYSDVSPFPLGDLELEIQGVPTYVAEFRFIGKCNGAKCVESVITATQNRVIIPRDKLTAGTFSCRVIQYTKGIETKIFPIEDLFLTDLDGNFSAEPVIVNLQNKIKSLETLLSEEKAAREKAENEVRTAKEYTDGILFGLAQFAFKDYQMNVYLDGAADIETFLKSFGITLSEEDKIRIKGE